MQQQQQPTYRAQIIHHVAHQTGLAINRNATVSDEASHVWLGNNEDLWVQELQKHGEVMAKYEDGKAKVEITVPATTPPATVASALLAAHEAVKSHL